MLKVPHYNTVYFLRYKHPRFKMQKQKNMLKGSLLFKKNINFTSKKLENS